MHGVSQCTPVMKHMTHNTKLGSMESTLYLTAHEALLAIPYSYDDEMTGFTNGDGMEMEVGRDLDVHVQPTAFVHNIVSTSLVMCSEMPINLETLHELLPCSSYDRKRFAAITIRVTNPKCTALLFTSGKLVVTGVRSWHECLLAAMCVTRIINTVVVRTRYWVANCDIQNIVAHSDMGLIAPVKLDIAAMYGDLGMECTYQKNMFPGLIYRAVDCPVVLLCFYSGKIVLTGGKYISDITDGWNLVYPIICRYIN
jgi:transcription initiation factor TFIID TATA-box-binding protein